MAVRFFTRTRVINALLALVAFSWLGIIAIWLW